MTRTLYLHAGPLKTGSTSVQAFFHDNAAVFQRQGLYRPETGTEARGLYHLGLINSFIRNHASVPQAAKLAAELEAHGLPEKVFLTAEMFAVRLGKRDYYNAIKAFARRLGYRLHVIVVIRPQAPLLNSLFTQAVKSWQPVTTVDAFLKTQGKSGRYAFHSLLSHLLNDGDVNFTALPFNREALDAGLSSTMCRVMELDLCVEGLMQPAVANTSPGPRTVVAFQRLRRRVAQAYPALDADKLSPLTWPLLRAASALGWNDVKFGGITPAQQNWLTDFFAADNEALAQRVWSKPWNQVFTEAENLAPPFNVFEPSKAAPPQRREFRGFIEQAMETIAELSGHHQGQASRM